MNDSIDVFGDDRLPPRFWAKVVQHESGCWLSTAAVSDRGYAKIWYAGKLWYAHRLAWTLLVGPIPDDHDIDHDCHNQSRNWCLDPDTCYHRRCIRISHVEPALHRVNMVRGNGITAINAAKTECLRKHPLSGANLYITPTGRRQCRACRAAAVRRHSMPSAT